MNAKEKLAYMKRMFGKGVSQALLEESHRLPAVLALENWDNAPPLHALPTIANPPEVEIISLEVRCPYCNCPWITPYGSCMGCGNLFLGTVAPVYQNDPPPRIIDADTGSLTIGGFPVIVDENCEKPYFIDGGFFKDQVGETLRKVFG